MQFSFKNILLCITTVSFVLTFNITFAATGFFWKAESPNSKTIYLFGTIHTDDNRVTDFSPSLISALKSSDLFIMETTAQNDSKAFTMQSGSLETMLTAEELEQVYALVEFHVMHRSAALRMKPWLLASVFDSPNPLTPFAQDNLLMTQAEDFGKRVIGIETAEQHFGVMDDLSLDEQLVMLRAVLKRTSVEKERDFEQIITAYLQGDLDKLAALNSKVTGSMLPPALWEKMRFKLLDERNIVMAERVMQEAKDSSLFVAVGASHLAGETGLVSSLKRSGFHLSPVK
jgi:uncharacterized protein YbaP (TraB family)